jgi:hypothetical protein
MADMGHNAPGKQQGPCQRLQRTAIPTRIQ